jgi:glycosyltransferase involved in cell wall biosynthesis
MNLRPVATPVPAEVPLSALRVPRCHEIIMVGTSLDVRGGIAAVVRGYRNGGLFDRFRITYVTTHREGSALGKALAALGAYARLCSALATASAPLIHIHLASRASFWRKSVVCALAAAWRRPYVLHLHGGDFSKFYDEECGGFAKAIVRRVLGRAAVVLALSEHWRATLLRICPDARVRTLPNSVALHSPGARNAAPDSLRILYTGRISERKGTFDLLRAFARVAPRFPQAVLICAGDGEGQRLLEQAESMGLKGRVVCPGWLSSEEVRKELDRASVFALPSHAEGVPMALLEAMSCGLPVVTTPVGGIPEVVQSTRNGLLVPPQDIDALEKALATVLDSPAERERLGTEARETIARHFSLSVTLDKLAAIYRDFGLQDRQA